MDNRYILLILGVVVCSSANANQGLNKFSYEDYDKKAGGMIDQMYKCSLIEDQFGSNYHACLSNLSTKVKTEHKDLINNNPLLVKNSVGFGELSYQFDGSLKNTGDCSNLYPVPLRNIFKNQIKQCQVQVEIMLYIKDAELLTEFGVG